MLYGLVGPHRAGKTTLAKRLAEDLGIEFYNTSTTEVARRHGFDSVAPMTLQARIALQTILLNHHLEQLDKLPRPLIVDRTPLDMLAYTMGEFHMNSHLITDPETLAMGSHFHDICIESTRLYYDMLFYLGPLENYVIEDGKPAPNLAYQKHIALLIQGGLLSLEGDVNFAIIGNTDFEFRSDYVHDSIVARIDEIGVARASSSLH